MPTNRSRRTRQRQATTLDQTQVEYLLTGQDPPRDTPGWSLMLSYEYFDGPEKIQRLWLENRSFLMGIWKKQGHPGLPWGAQFDDGGTD